MKSDRIPEPAKSGAGGWMEISLCGPCLAMEAIADFVYQLGSAGAVFAEDPKARPGTEMLTAFLPRTEELDAKLRELRAYLAALRRLWPDEVWSELETRTVIEQDWVEEWKRNFGPLPVGERFWVVPTWREIPEPARKPGKLVIRLDPGLAFGTGLHASTRACLGQIERLVPHRARSVLDLGTGSGILAIAARMLGAQRVLAVDLDPSAVKVAQANAELNGLKGIEFLVAGGDPGASFSARSFDLVLANIFAAELIRLKPLLLRHLAPAGRLVLAGILYQQAAAVAAAFQDSGLRLREQSREEEWVALIFEGSGGADLS